MASAYFDCFSGVSGDMLVGAFIDAGFDFNSLKIEVGKLGLSGYELSCEKILKNGIACTSFNVSVTKEQPCRNLADITDIVMCSTLDDVVKNDILSIFRIIGEAEARIHMKSLKDIHFHEIGAVDSIIDICGAVLALRMMDIDHVAASPVNIGRGFVRTEHGLLPVPAPATAEILKSVPVYSMEVEGELATPTGAAILSFYAEKFSYLHEINPRFIGYGAGKKDLDIPNLLRLYISY